MELAAEESVRIQSAEEGVSIVEYLLDGLEEALELERELGVRSVAFDRTLLQTGKVSPIGAPSVASAPTAPVPATDEDVRCPSAISTASSSAAKGGGYDFVFLHHAALSPAAVEMMAKIIHAMGKTAETAPVIIAPPIPKARVYVIMGWGALKKFLPGKQEAPGTWIKTPGGKDALVTYSPEFILRFGEVTPAVKQMKQSMWQGLKAVKQRIAL